MSWKIAFACAAAVAAWAGWIAWEARQSVSLSIAGYEAGLETPFERLRWTPPPPGAKSFETAADFRDATAFSESVFLAGSGGIQQFDSSGARLRTWRPGLEIPAAPVTALAEGLDPGTGRRSLFAATAGAGVLVLAEDGGVEQVRAADKGRRDLTALLPLADGRLLIGSEQEGVLAWDSGGMRPLHDDLRGLRVTALAGDAAELWVGTIDRGVLRFAGGAVQAIGGEQGLPDARVLSLAVAGESTYVGTAHGVAEVSGGSVVRTLAEGVIASAVTVEDGKLFVGSFDQGIAEIALDLSRWTQRAAWRDEPGQTRRFLRLDGALYALAADGLYPLAAGGALEAPGAVLTDRNISALARTSDGRLWVGYFDRGLDIMDDAGDLAAHLEDETIFCVNRIVEDADEGVVYVATANGLALLSLDGEVREVRRKEQGLIANHVTDLVIRDSELAVATPAGLTFFGRGGARSLYALQGLVNNHVYAVGAAGPELIAGTLGGVSRLRGDVVERSWTTANSAIGHNWVTAVERLGADWLLGTYGSGVVRLAPDGSVTNPPELADVEINPNALVVGTTAFAGGLDRGLLVYDRDGQRWIEHLTGLPSSNVTALTLADGFVYVGTDNGLTALPESAILEQ